MPCICRVFYFKKNLSSSLNNGREISYSTKFNDSMKKSIFPTISLICLIVISITLVYQHFFNDGINRDGWLTLLLMISVSLTHLPYWKKYFK